jgi:hypothetical protein
LRSSRTTQKTIDIAQVGMFWGYTS